MNRTLLPLAMIFATFHCGGAQAEDGASTSSSTQRAEAETLWSSVIRETWSFTDVLNDDGASRRDLGTPEPALVSMQKARSKDRLGANTKAIRDRVELPSASHAEQFWDAMNEAQRSGSVHARWDQFSVRRWQDFIVFGWQVLDDNKKPRTELDLFFDKKGSLLARRFFDIEMPNITYEKQRESWFSVEGARPVLGLASIEGYLRAATFLRSSGE